MVSKEKYNRKELIGFLKFLAVLLLLVALFYFVSPTNFRTDVIKPVL